MGLVPRSGGYYSFLMQALSNFQTNRIENIEHTGQLLLALARKAQLARRMDVVDQTSRLMLALPLSKQLKGIAFFHQAPCLMSRGELEKARYLFEKASEEATPQYRARAIQCIGATYYERGEPDKALPFYLAARKYAADCDPLTVAQSQWMIAIVKSIYGDHKRALDDLENLFPLIRIVSKYQPALYYDYLNSIAVEFSEIGRIAEAQSAISIALSSSFAPAYPAWSETRNEIEQKRNYPDLSRCFIERSLNESAAISETNISSSIATERQIKADISSQRQSTVETNPFRSIPFHRFIKLTSCQRTLTLPDTVALFVTGGSAKSFLQRLGRSVQLRGPPAFPYTPNQIPKV